MIVRLVLALERLDRFWNSFAVVSTEYLANFLVSVATVTTNLAGEMMTKFQSIDRGVDFSREAGRLCRQLLRARSSGHRTRVWCARLAGRGAAHAKDECAQQADRELADVHCRRLTFDLSGPEGVRLKEGLCVIAEESWP